MANPKFEIQKSTDDQHYWNLIAGNGEKILTSERYTTRSSAVNAIESVKTNAVDDERYDKRTASTGRQHYFALLAANGQVLGTSEMYDSKSARDGGIEAVKRNAAEAEVEVEG